MTKIKLSEKEIERRREADKEAVASLRLEGFQPSQEDNELTELYITGQITRDEWFKKIQESVEKITANNHQD